MMMLGGGFAERRGPRLAIGIKRMRTFHHTPAKVVALFHKINLLPKILPVITNPYVPGLCVAMHAPWIAKPISPGFPGYILLAEEWVILGNGVIFAFLRVIHINAKHLAQWSGKVLP